MWSLTDSILYMILAILTASFDINLPGEWGMLFIQRWERSERLWILKGVSVGGSDVCGRHYLQQVGVSRTVTAQSQFRDLASSSLTFSKSSRYISELLFQVLCVVYMLVSWGRLATEQGRLSFNHPSILSLLLISFLWHQVKVRNLETL